MSVDPFARHYSDRLGRLTGEQLQAALDRFDLGRLLAAKPTAAGLFGQNVFLSSTKGEWVLRGAPHFDWQLPKEQFFARFIHQRTDVGAPWPYQIETSTELFGWSFAIMPRLPTIEVPDEPKPQRELARAMGDALARLHQPAFEAPGAYDLAPLPRSLREAPTLPARRPRAAAGLLALRLRRRLGVRPAQPLLVPARGPFPTDRGAPGDAGATGRPPRLTPRPGSECAESPTPEKSSAATKAG